MQRAIERLSAEQFDVTVVGGGIYGANIAYRAACDGYKVALIEAGDFACGTSANSLKILHGGLRYLQHLNVSRIRESLRSRAFYLNHSPHLINITPFLIPLSGRGTDRPMVMRAGFLLYQAIAAAWSRQLPAALRPPMGKILTSQAVAEHFPELGWLRTHKAGLWHEAVAEQTTRLVLSLVSTATERGAVAANYVSAVALEHENQQIRGVRCHDQASGQRFLIQSKWVIDASGHKVGQLGEGFKDAGGKVPPPVPRFARANNLIVKRRLFGSAAVGLPVHDTLKDTRSVARRKARMIFFVPWRDRTLIGTFYQAADSVAHRLALDAHEKAHILEQVNGALPEGALNDTDICHWHSGWLPLREAASGGARDESIELDDEARITVYPQAESGEMESGTGLIEVLGVKFTTAPEVAKSVVGKLAAQQPPRPQPSPPRRAPSKPKTGLETRLCARYGADWPKVKAVLDEHPSHFTLVNSEVLDGEIRYIVRQEMVVHLVDVICRRLPIGECGLDFASSAAKSADIMQQELGWDHARHALELKQALAYQHDIDPSAAL